MEKCYADSYSTSLGQLIWSSISFWDQIVGLVLIDHFVMMNIMVAYILYYMPKSFHMMTSKVPHESSLIAVYMQQKWFLGGVMLFFPSLKLRYIAHLIFCMVGRLFRLPFWVSGPWVRELINFFVAAASNGHFFSWFFE